MSDKVPLRLATWILKRFGSSPNSDAITGDLMEQYQRGRSRWWFWKQVAIAILCGSSGWTWGLLTGVMAGAISIAGNIGTSLFPDAAGPLFLAVAGFAAARWWRRTGLGAARVKHLVWQMAHAAAWVCTVSDAVFDIWWYHGKPSPPWWLLAFNPFTVLGFIFVFYIVKVSGSLALWGRGTRVESPPPQAD